MPGLQGAFLSLAFQGPRLDDPERDTVELVSALLSGLGGRLSKAIREEKGLAYDVVVRGRPWWSVPIAWMERQT